MFSMLLMLLLLLVRVGLLVGLLVVTGEEEGGASSDFRLLAGLLANLGGRRVENYLLLKHLKLLVVKWIELVVVVANWKVKQ